MTQGTLFDVEAHPEAAAEPHVPYAPTSQTSRQAAEEIKPHAGIMLQQVREFILGRGGYGATDEEIREATRLKGDTSRARRCELRDRGEIVDSGETRKTASNRAATVWIAAKLAGRSPAAGEAEKQGRPRREVLATTHIQGTPRERPCPF
jgi:hypothetical protein